ncbi:MAG TPA: PAS domain S-box protein [Gaiellaceae bacterium]
MDAADEVLAFDLAGVLEQLPNAVILVALSGAIVFANECARSRLGLSALTGRRLSDLPLQVVDEAGRSFPGTGSGIRARARELRDEEQRVVGTLVLLDDAVEARPGREPERLLAAAAASSRDAIIATTLDGEIRSWNRGAEEMYGYAAEEVLGRQISILAPPERHDETARLLGRLEGGERIDSFETIRVAKDGRRLCVSLTISAIVDEGGALVGASAIAHDLTAQRRGERERHQPEEELRQAQRLESVGRLAGGIAHEFNNLLQIIGGFSKRLLARAPDDVSRRELLAIDDATARAAGLVRQLLAFGGRQRLQPRPFDLNLLIDDYEPMLRALVGNDVELHCRLELRLPQIEADPSQLEQVLTNLALNAREAMPDGGSLVVSTGSAALDPDAAHAHGLPEGDYVLLRVSDTGVGMDDATRERIFEPFFSTRPPTEASGLGLATVHGIVAQSRGAISVDSEPGRGSKFTIYLPKLQSRVQQLPPPAPTDERRREPALVLVVEDEPLLLELMEVNLRDAGYHVLSAESPRRALELVRRERVDLVVTDVVMPELNGPELVERVRELQPGLPALYVSGYAEQAISRSSRLEPLLSKPFAPDDLLAAVAALLRSGERSQTA